MSENNRKSTSTQNGCKRMMLFFSSYLAFMESWVAFVNPSKARFRKHSPYPRGAFGRANLLIVFELVWNWPKHTWQKHKNSNKNCYMHSLIVWRITEDKLQTENWRMQKKSFIIVPFLRQYTHTHMHTIPHLQECKYGYPSSNKESANIFGKAVSLLVDQSTH